MSDISVGILLVGRMGSSRLKNKLLLEVCGMPLVQHTAERLLRSKSCEAVIMCTTTDPEDDVLANRWSNSPVGVFRGSPGDPFRRMLACAEKLGFSHFIYAGADDVLLDPELCDFLTTRIAHTGADMTLMDNIVCGFTPFLFSTSAARRLAETVDGVLTIPEKYMKDMAEFTVDEVPVDGFEYLERPDIRATLDYDVDFEFFKAIISALYPTNPLYTNREVMAFLNTRPEIIALNRGKHIDWAARQMDEYKGNIL
jgi:spore coat polysaccharide biosynthesis protein SpsF